jgi:hypothetical protein
MSLANDTCEIRSLLKLQKTLCSVHKPQGCSVSLIEHLKKEKMLIFVCHENCCWKGVVPAHGNIAVASCLSCHIFLTLRQERFEGQSGWEDWIDTHLNFQIGNTCSAKQ